MISFSIISNLLNILIVASQLNIGVEIQLSAQLRLPNLNSFKHLRYLVVEQRHKSGVVRINDVDNGVLDILQPPIYDSLGVRRALFSAEKESVRIRSSLHEDIVNRIYLMQLRLHHRVRLQDRRKQCYFCIVCYRALNLLEQHAPIPVHDAYRLH